MISSMFVIKNMDINLIFIFNYSTFFQSHYLNIIYKNTYYGTFKTSNNHKNTVICIYLLES